MAVDTPKANGLKTVVDTIVAPKEAFESIRVAPTWAWGLLVSIVLVAVSSYLLVPALLHGYPGTFAQLVASDPRLANASADQIQSIQAFNEKLVSLGWVFAPFVVAFAALVAAVVMLVFDKVSHGEGSFSRYWAVACNIGVPVLGIGSIVSAIIVVARGADSFASVQAVQQAVPSFAMLAPGASPKLTALLATLTPFMLWGLGLNVFAMRVVGRVSTVPAWLAGIVILLIPGLFAMAGAK
jgi:hypothetical protein